MTDLTTLKYTAEHEWLRLEGDEAVIGITDYAADKLGEQRAALRLRHSQRLTALMEARRDLRGVHALADFVDDSVRWSA